MKTEPAIILGAVQAAIVLAVSFGLELSVEQQAALFSIAAVVLSIVTRQLVTPIGKPKSKGKGSAALLVLLVALSPALVSCGGALGVASRAAHVVGDALSILDGVSTKAQAYFDRHPSLDNSQAVADAIKLAREAVENGEHDQAVKLYEDARELIDSLGIPSATPPDGGAETDAPAPEPFELPTVDEFKAAL
jgi:hypothetical protein